MVKVDWSKELLIILIENYEAKPCLYDPKNKFYSNKHARNDALLRILDDLKEKDDNIEVEDIKKKITNLRQQFSHENSKIQESQRSGAGVDEVYEPTVWWFDKLLFLMPHVKIRKSKSTLDSLPLTRTRTESESQSGVEEDDMAWMNEPSSSSEAQMATPKTSFKKKKDQLKETGDPIINKTLETLQQLEYQINKPSEKSDNQIFGDYIASELNNINDAMIIANLKHNINKLLFDAKMEWLSKDKETGQEFIFEVVDD